MKVTNVVLMCMVLFLTVLSSCRKHKAAPVIDRSKTKSASYKQNSQTLSRHQKYSRRYIKVKKGDTLYSIGFANNIDYKKLAKINNIASPYRIFPGQKLRLKQKKSSTNNTVVKTPKAASSKVKANTSKVINTDKNQSAAIKKSPKQPTITKISPTKTITVKTQPISNSQWIWPVKGRLLSTFSQSDVSRKGIDIAIGINKSVVASNHGTVVYSGDGLRGYGELIIIKHSNNLLSAYAHNSKRLVKEGQNVKQGQEIAKTGKGTDGRALLHFEIRKNGKPVNPTKYLPKM